MRLKNSLIVIIVATNLFKQDKDSNKRVDCQRSRATKSNPCMETCSRGHLVYTSGTISPSILMDEEPCNSQISDSIGLMVEGYESTRMDGGS